MADFETGLQQLGQSIRSMRMARGYSQLQVATMAGVPRLKVIHVEAGRATVAIAAYAKVAAALGGQMIVTPQQRPTLDEIRQLLEDDRG